MLNFIKLVQYANGKHVYIEKSRIIGIEELENYYIIYTHSVEFLVLPFDVKAVL